MHPEEISLLLSISEDSHSSKKERALSAVALPAYPDLSEDPRVRGGKFTKITNLFLFFFRPYRNWYHLRPKGQCGWRLLGDHTTHLIN